MNSGKIGLFWQRAAGATGLNASMASMIVMVILIGMGEKMAERFLPLYIVALGGSTWAVGFLNALDNFLSAIYSFPGGYLSDRLGHKKALSVFTCIALTGYLIVIVIPSWQAVLIGAVFFIAWTAVSLPAIMSLVAQMMPKNKRTLGVSIHSLVRRIPMALGPVAGGMIIGLYGTVSGIRIAFGIALILGLVSLYVQWRYMADTVPEQEAASAAEKSAAWHPALRNLLVSDILIRFAEQIPYAFVVIWAVNNLGLTPLQFAVLTTVEMITAMLIYLPVAYFADKHTKKPFVLMTFGFFTLFPLVLFYSRSFEALLFAFFIRGCKEFGEPTRKALIMDLAPEHAKARTFGKYYLIRDIIVAGAALSSAYLWDISPQINFMAAFTCGLAGTLWFAVFGKDLPALK